MKIALVAVTAALVAGCATPVDPNKITLNVITNPPGAMIYESDRVLAQSPAPIVYTISPSARAAGKITTRPITVVWPSGAKATASPSLFLTTGHFQQFVFSRPIDAPGLDKDLQYSAQMQQLNYARRNADAAERQAAAAEFAAVNSMPQNTWPTTVTCKTSGSKTTCN